MRINFNYRVLGSSTTAIFLSNYHSLYAPNTSDGCHARVHLYGNSRPAMNATKYKIKNCQHCTRTNNLEICRQVLYRLSYPGFDESCPIKVTFIHILTSNENATPKCTSISERYIEYTFTEDFWWFYEYKRLTQH